MSLPENTPSSGTTPHRPSWVFTAEPHSETGSASAHADGVSDTYELSSDQEILPPIPTDRRVSFYRKKHTGVHILR